MRSILFTFFALSALAFPLRGQQLPPVTGPYPVGTSILHLSDGARPDLVSNKAGREIMLQFWYPVGQTDGGKTISYLPDPSIEKTFLDQQYDLQSQSVIEGLGKLKIDATMDAPILVGSHKYPLLVLSPGLGEPRSNYTGFSMDLASHGYVVVCIDHPYGGFTVLPDKRVLTTNSDPRGGTPEGAESVMGEWSADASFVLTELMSRGSSLGPVVTTILKNTDFQNVGMLGHSLGGAAALETCRVDARFKACADLDGAPFGKVKTEGVKRPTLIMRSAPVYSDEDLAKKGRTREQWDQMGREGQLMWASILPRASDIPFYNVRVVGTGHMSYSDSPFTMPDVITRFGGKIIEPKLGFEIISRCLRDFFGKYLKREPAGLLDAEKSSYPELVIERHNL